MESTRHIFRVEWRDISYLRYTIESYDGMAVVRTLDPHGATIEVTVSPGCEELVFELIDSLVRDEGLLMDDMAGQENAPQA
jgi:uncharacterized protein DUF4911